MKHLTRYDSCNMANPLEIDPTTMKDLGPFNIMPDQRTDMTAVVPVKPPKNKYGFVLSPINYVSSGHSAKSCACPTCNKNSEVCNNNVHHSYWPKTPRRRSKAKQHFKSYDKVPDYRRRSLSALRLAPFAISDTICERWHDKLHSLQAYPTIDDIPEDEVISLAISQFKLYGRARTLIRETAIHTKKWEASADNVLEALTSQEEFVFPVRAYYTMTESNKDEILNKPLPLTHDLEGTKQLLVDGLSR